MSDTRTLPLQGHAVYIYGPQAPALRVQPVPASVLFLRMLTINVSLVLRCYVCRAAICTAEQEIGLFLAKDLEPADVVVPSHGGLAASAIAAVQKMGKEGVLMLPTRWLQACVEQKAFVPVADFQAELLRSISEVDSMYDGFGMAMPAPAHSVLHYTTTVIQSLRLTPASLTTGNSTGHEQPFNPDFFGGVAPFSGMYGPPLPQQHQYHGQDPLLGRRGPQQQLD
eukprot:3931-Heterococcus_DN1.PRE.1